MSCDLLCARLVLLETELFWSWFLVDYALRSPLHDYSCSFFIWGWQQHDLSPVLALTQVTFPGELLSYSLPKLSSGADGVCWLWFLFLLQELQADFHLVFKFLKKKNIECFVVVIAVRSFTVWALLVANSVWPFDIPSAAGMFHLSGGDGWLWSFWNSVKQYLWSNSLAISPCFFSFLGLPYCWAESWSLSKGFSSSVCGLPSLSLWQGHRRNFSRLPWHTSWIPHWLSGTQTEILSCRLHPSSYWTSVLALSYCSLAAKCRTLFFFFCQSLLPRVSVRIAFHASLSRIQCSSVVFCTTFFRAWFFFCRGWHAKGMKRFSRGSCVLNLLRDLSNATQSETFQLYHEGS